MVLSGLLLAWSSLLRKNTTHLVKLRRYVDDGNQVLALFWHGNFIFRSSCLPRGTNAVVLTNDSFRGRVIGRHLPPLWPHSGSLACRNQRQRVVAFDPVVHPPASGAGCPCPGWTYGPVSSDSQSGAIYLSAQKGVRLVPIGVASQRKLALSCRWDRQQIPLPGSRVALAVGDMINLAPFAGCGCSGSGKGDSTTRHGPGHAGGREPIPRCNEGA